jgi:hypothetical protein
MANPFTAPILLLLGALCVLPARSAAADGQEKRQGTTRPAISQEVVPLEAIVPVAKDGHKGEAYVRKPPGKRPFPAVVLIHGDIVRWPTTQLKEYALGAWSSRYLAAGYVVGVTTYRSRDVDPQTRSRLTTSSLRSSTFENCLTSIRRASSLTGRAGAAIWRSPWQRKPTWP